MTTKESRCYMGIKNIFEFKAIVSFQNSNIIVSGVHNLEYHRISEDFTQKGKTQAVEGIEEVRPSFCLYLNETENFPKIPEGIIFRINTDDRRGADIFFRLFHF
jgi:hypothetical protein